MEAEKILFICTMIALSSVLLMEFIKLIVKRVAKKKGKELNMKKAEYILTSLPIITTFAGIYIFLHYKSELGLDEVLKLCSIFATSTQTIYTFGVQIARKGITGIVHGLQKLFKKKDKGTSLVEQAKGVVDEMEKTKTEESGDKEESLDDFLQRIGK